MAAGEVASFPKHFAGGGVETGCAKAAEVDIEPARLDDRRRRRVTIHRGAVAERLGVVAVEHLFVETDGASFGVEADGEEVMAVEGGSSQPDLPAQNYGCGPTAIGNFCFPLDVVRLVQRSGRPTGSVSPGAAARPSPHGPRNSGQSARAAGAPKANKASARQRSGLLWSPQTKALRKTENGLLSQFMPKGWSANRGKSKDYHVAWVYEEADWACPAV